MSLFLSKSRHWRRAQEAFGPVHILCNNAGVVLWGGLESVTYQDWQWAMGVNIWGVIHGVQAFVPEMVANGQGGHIVNTASIAGLIASQGLGIYNTTNNGPMMSCMKRHNLP